jgi:hypothetical protein
MGRYDEQVAELRRLGLDEDADRLAAADPEGGGLDDGSEDEGHQVP